MIEQTGNIFTEIGKANALCITTNGTTKTNGEAVCGRGIAQTAAQRWPQFAKTLGNLITQHGNKVHIILTDKTTIIISFPTKHHWRNPSNTQLIHQSTQQLLNLANTQNLTRIALPRPGCQNGGLQWHTVKNILQPLLDNRFIIYNQPEPTPPNTP
jgi:O-acetyl-ADP-ribose deacetylase (regulator of RNase III)